MPASVALVAFCIAVLLAVAWVEHRYPEDEQ